MSRRVFLSRHIVFWIFFTILGIWGQFFLPGTDFFTPGLVVLVQFGFLNAAFWLGCLWMLLLEGTGNLAFGTIILYYAGLAMAYSLAGVFFEARNVLFMALLFLFLAVFKKALVLVMAGMQDLGQSVFMDAQSVLVQFTVHLILWMLTYHFFNKYIMHELVRRKKPVA